MLHNKRKLNALKKKTKDFGLAPFDHKNTALIRLVDSWEMSADCYDVLTVEGEGKLDDFNIEPFLEAVKKQGFKGIFINTKNIQTDALWRILYFLERYCSNIYGTTYTDIYGDVQRAIGLTF